MVYETLFECAPDGVVAVDASGLVTHANREAHRLFGYGPGELIGVHVEGLVPGHPWSKDPIAFGADFVGRRQDGTGFPLDISVAASELEGQPSQVAIVRDISEQRLLISELRKTEGRLALAQEVARMGYWDWDQVADTVECSDELYRIFGLTLPQDGGKPYEPFQGVHPDDLDRLKKGIQAGLESRQNYEIEHRILHATGEVRFVVARGLATYDDETGEQTRVFGVSHDVTELRKAEHELRTSDAHYRDLVEAAGDMIFMTDLAGTVLSLNRAAEEVLGHAREHLVGRSGFDVLLGADDAEVGRAYIESVIAGQPSSEFLEISMLAEDGTRVPVEASARVIRADASPSGLLWIARDLSERNRLESQLRQAQKMDAVGSLAAGIAHDFNNVLLVIRGLSDLLLKQMDEGDLRQSVARIDEAAEHAAELTHQLLAFSRQQVLRPEPTDLNDVVEASLKVLTRTIREDIEVALDLDPSLHPILIDPGQLRQVIFNLAVNARDAMPTGGKLTIRTANTELDAAFARVHPEVAAGSQVLLQITDSGQGMDEATRTRVFDPFFTTKAEGTGLGLATVYGIVKQSGGYIWLYSEPGLGTTFKIYLPSTSAAVAKVPAAPQKTTTLRGKGKILVVEDDAMVRMLVAQVLESYGYTVHTIGMPLDALQIPEEEIRSFDLLMTDIVMPGMSGRELAERIVAMHPSVRVLFTSGYPEDTAIRHEISEARAHFLEKPYLPDELADMIRKIFAGAPPGL